MHFFDNTNTHDGMVLDKHNEDASGKSFDNLHRHITTVVSKQENLTSGKKSNRAILQVFTDFTANSFIRLYSYSSFQENVGKDETLKPNDLLFQVQWQVRLRLALWERMGSKAFVSSWAQQILQDLPPKRRRRAQKQGHGEQQAWKLCCEDMTSLLSLGLMKLAHERSGALLQVENFLNSCGLQHVRQQAPWKLRLVRDVWTFFDLVHDPKPSQKKSEQPSAVLPPLPVQEEESVKTISTASTVSTNKENASSYFGKQIKLTAPAAKKTNSLLGKSGRTQFVGSHFNTNLTNMSALFRSVPSGRQDPLRKQDNAPVVRKRPLSRVQVADSPPSKINHLSLSSIKVAETPAIPQRKRSRVICETPQDLYPRRALPL
eukprot:scaffold6586_cov138-Amphora_coffeaeformis.AAC.1